MSGLVAVTCLGGSWASALARSQGCRPVGLPATWASLSLGASVLCTCCAPAMAAGAGNTAGGGQPEPGSLGPSGPSGVRQSRTGAQPLNSCRCVEGSRDRERVRACGARGPGTRDAAAAPHTCARPNFGTCGSGPSRQRGPCRLIKGPGRGRWSQPTQAVTRCLESLSWPWLALKPEGSQGLWVPSRSFRRKTISPP